MSFLHKLESVGITIGKDALGVEKVVAPFLPTVAGAFGGPPAAAAVNALMAAIAKVQREHDAKSDAAAGAVVVDTRKADIMAWVPLVESLIAMTGHPIENTVEFNDFLGAAIDAGVYDWKAYAAFEVWKASLPKVEAKAA